MRPGLKQPTRQKPIRFPMNDEVNSEASAAAGKPKKARAKKSTAAAEAPEPAKKRTPAAKTRKTGAKSAAAKPAAKAAPKKKASTRRKAAAADEIAELAAITPGITAPFEDPIGDVSDGEARAYTGEYAESEAESEAEAYRAGVAADAVDGTLETVEPDSQKDAVEDYAAPARIAEEVARDREREAGTGAYPPAKLERLQKILSQAGIASRRKAEEMIVAGRVAVNGQIVTALGSKADPERDHIRVDGKLLHGAERHRYFLLNKPRGYVTTVSDPEGRPTVMDLVQKLGERVYPVGRLDFQSEGLLLMTNDGALANQLTHASSGVEKIYLVKIAGQPDEEQLDRLRSGVMIERGGPSSSGQYGAGGRVRTAPARIRQIRPGENPWYEVVLTEGRNRELRKMFSAIGHYVEKIRRVGYGPLVLDVEPGKLRELTIGEVEALRLSAEGKLKPRRLKTEAMLPKEAGRTAEARPARGEKRRPLEARPASRETRRPAGTEAWRPPQAGPAKPYGKPRPERGAERDFRRGEQGGFAAREPRGRGQERPGAREFSGRGEDRSGASEFRGRGQERSGSKERPQREFHETWQLRDEQQARRGPDQSQRGFGRRREERSSGPGERSRSFGRQGQERSSGPEDRESRNRPNRPGARWDRSAGDRPFRSEGRPGQGGGKSSFGTGAKPGGKGRSGGFGDRASGSFGSKGKTGGFSGARGQRGPGRFSGKGKSGGFRSGPRPGGGRTGGKRGG
jgi:23S rRNA pseudouridine2605 synthase